LTSVGTLGSLGVTGAVTAGSFVGPLTGNVTGNTSGTAANVTGIVLGANGGTGVANTGSTITLGGNLTTSGAFATTLTTTALTNVTLPTSGTLATLGGAETLTNKTLTSPVINTPTGIVKADVGLGSVENTALSTWAGTTNLTTLGTLTSGTWNAGVIAGQYGGTGVNNTGKTITLGGNLTTSGAFATTLTTTALTNVTLPTSGTLLTTSGNGSGLTGLTGSQITGDILGNSANVTGTVAVANGGTGQTAALVPGGVLYGNTATAAGVSVAGTAGQVLRSNGAAAPTWQNAGAGDMIAANAETVGGIKTFSALPVFSTLTVGSVPFIGAGKALSEDNANLFWDNTNKWLGIGTAVPSAPLTVVGDVNINANGSSPASPRTVGIIGVPAWIAGNAARYTFGDAWNALQNAYGDRMQIVSYHGVDISGSRGVGVALGFVPGTGTDASLNVIGTRLANPILTVTSAAGQTGNLQEWRNSGGTALATLSSTGSITSVGITSAGADVNLNANSNFNTNINTGTSTGTVTVGSSSDLQTVNIGTGTAAATVNIATGNTASKVKIGNTGTQFSSIIFGTVPTTALAIPDHTLTSQTYTFNGATIGAAVIVNSAAAITPLGIFISYVRVSAANTIEIVWYQQNCNCTLSLTVGQTLNIMVINK
jgi:trimeric autotransporter adhesin